MKRNQIVWGILILLVIIIIIGLATKNRRGDEGNMVPAGDQTSQDQRTGADKLLGTWIGPEGTSLIVLKEGAGYELNFVMLDGPMKMSGMEVGNGIAFMRDGKSYTLRAGSGVDTGMKWLAEKKDCVVVQQSEGYCRD